MPGTDIKLYYFNGRGRAELTRLLFAAKGKKPGVDYEDIRIDFNDWPNHKEEAPFKQMPYMEIDGKKVAESLSIARMIAHRLDLAGSGPEEQALADMVATGSRSLFDYLARIHHEEKDDARKDTMREYVKTKQLPWLLSGLSEVAGEDKFFFGDDITWADIAFYDSLYMLVSHFPNTLAEHENLQRIYKNVEEYPNIKAWLESRPQTEF